MKMLASLRAALIAGALALLAGGGYVAAQSFGPIIVQSSPPSGPIIQLQGTPNNGIYIQSNHGGFTRHFGSGSTATANLPVLTSCGTTPTLATGSTDQAGTITMGTTATGCVVTFGTAYAAAPNCRVTWRATPLASQSYTTSTTALTLTQTSTSNNLVDYDCRAMGS